MIPNPNLYPEPFEKVETDVSVGSFSGQPHIASNAQINCHFRIIFTGVTWITFYPKSSLVEIIDSTNCFLNLKTKKYQVLRFSEKNPWRVIPLFLGNQPRHGAIIKAPMRTLRSPRWISSFHVQKTCQRALRRTSHKVSISS